MSLIRRVMARSAIEMSADRAFRLRIVRLAAVSAVALGIIWALAADVRQVGLIPMRLLASGWALMPTVLLASLGYPRLRYALVVPATLVTIALGTVSLDVLSRADKLAAGWLLVTSGVLVGDILGLWFWFRLVPVPSALNDPFSRDRWALVGLHVALVAGGLVLIGARI